MGNQERKSHWGLDFVLEPWRAIGFYLISLAASNSQKTKASVERSCWNGSNQRQPGVLKQYPEASGKEEDGDSRIQRAVWTLTGGEEARKERGEGGQWAVSGGRQPRFGSPAPPGGALTGSGPASPRPSQGLKEWRLGSPGSFALKCWCRWGSLRTCQSLPGAPRSSARPWLNMASTVFESWWAARWTWRRYESVLCCLDADQDSGIDGICDIYLI